MRCDVVLRSNKTDVEPTLVGRSQGPERSVTLCPTTGYSPAGTSHVVRWDALSRGFLMAACGWSEALLEGANLWFFRFAPGRKRNG
jgi:hypothetical protein